jgi:ABC-type multidrug transport system ATPase subunit
MDIAIQQLTKVYGGKIYALNCVDLTIGSGIFGLLGPNGAGKTTLMRILAGILRPTSGSVRIGLYDGATERGRTAVKRILGYLPQELGVYPDLSAREFLDYIAILKGIEQTAERKRRVTSLLEIVGLADVANRKMKGFSGGMKRRVGIAQALLNHPQLLIVDEPTAGLDPEERIHFRNLLADLAGDRTVLLSTHIVEDVAQMGQRLAVMLNGRVAFQGTTNDLIQEAQGHVWTLTSSGAKPEGDLTVVSILHAGNGIHYRIVGLPHSGLAAQPAEPTLEDSYVWLMREQRDPLAAAVS